MAYRSAKFIDDYWLAFVLSSREAVPWPRLVLLNTEPTGGGTAPIQTTFHFDPREHPHLEVAYLCVEPGGHEPSPEEGLFAPFYPDASQRVLAVHLRGCESILVLKTEELLRLARERGGAALEWEQWRVRGIEVWPRDADVVDLWVSGPRLFFIARDTFGADEIWMDVYDFSAQASTRNLETTTDWDGTVQRCMSPSIRKYHLPWNAPVVHFANGGHDGIVLIMVNTPLPRI